MANKEEAKKSVAQELKEKLFFKPKTVFDVINEEESKKIFDYCENYKKFLDNGKTEREVVKESIALAEANGFVPFNFGMKVEKGGKYYYNNRGKALALFVVGTECLENGVYIAAAHIDSPRIDIKPNPMYEADGLAYFKTHYYGGIKKYQWTAIPLALHGAVTKADGTTVEVCIGEDESDPIFYISDLLPHLAGDQMRKPLGDAIAGEQLNILIGSTPFAEEKTPEATKLNILKILNEKYGIVEADFLSAELSIVPAFKSRDVGLDRGLIGSYGHDDRVCAYPALTAIFDAKNPTHTLMSVLADKEEVGSMGNTGMQSAVYFDIIADIANTLGANFNAVRANSKCLSADVNAALDPTFPEVHERRNASFINRGAVITKYTGSRGKGGTSDASAEFVGYIRNILDKAGVVWQIGELGKVDQGGGGTVAQYIANLNVDVVDLGVPVLSMHAPWELISKNDIYMAHRAIYEFFIA